MADAGLTAAFLSERAMLLRLLTARLGSAADAEDALQDLWLRIGDASGAPVANPAAYLFRMATNLATDRRLMATRRATLDTAWAQMRPDAVEYPDAERRLLDREALARVESVLSAMPARMQAAYRLFRIEQMPQRAIADRLGVSVSAVEKLLQRAYRRFHDIADGGDDDG
jgi:RNA polymerase sigma-70 factor (ECF subfamily)